MPLIDCRNHLDADLACHLDATYPAKLMPGSDSPLYSPIDPTSPWVDGEPPKRAHYEKKILLGRVGETDDCAGPAGFRCAEASRYLTGQIIVVDGGLTGGRIGQP